MRVAIYARISTERQEEENQLAELREFVARKGGEGWSLAVEYVDKMSGSRSDRPQFRKMLDDAAKKKFDMLVFWALDRFTREGVLATLKYLERLSNSGVEWWSYREEFLRSVGIFRDAVLAIMATLAQQERIRIQERVRAGLETARRRGKQLGRPVRVFSRDEVVRLRDEEGLPWREIGRLLDIAPMTALKAYRKEKGASE